MAVVSPPLWLKNVATHQAVHYRKNLVEGLMGPSVSAVGGPMAVGDCVVTANGTPNMTVNTSGGRVLVANSSAAYGAYLLFNDAIVNLAISAAHATLARKDLVVVRVADQEVTGAANLAEMVVITGTPAGAPADPALPAGFSYYVLARVNVGPAVTVINAGNIDDLRSAKAIKSHGRIRGTETQRGTWPTADLTQGDEWFATDSNRIWLWSGSVWLLVGGSFPQCRAYRTAALSPATGVSTVIGMDTEDYKTDAGMHNNVTNPERLVATIAGRYAYGMSTGWAPNATGGRTVQAVKNAATILRFSRVAGFAATSAAPTLNGAVDLAVGDYIKVQADQSSGGALAITPGLVFTYCDLTYVGPS